MVAGQRVGLALGGAGLEDLADVGPGAWFRLPTSTFVTRVRPGLYEVATMTQAEVSVPEK